MGTEHPPPALYCIGTTDLTETRALLYRRGVWARLNHSLIKIAVSTRNILFGVDMAILEEELKNRIGELYFKKYDYNKILGRIDFCVTKKQESSKKQQDLFLTNDADMDSAESLFWAEAKAGTRHDIYTSIVQLILTIGREKTYENHITPPFIGAFDAEKIAFLPWITIESVFSLNDFNWNVAPSDHKSKEFQKLYAMVKKTLDEKAYLFKYENDDAEIREFIAKNLAVTSANVNQIVITKNNFTSVYYKWVNQVKDSIAVHGGWGELKKAGIIDADFYLADLLSEDGISLKEALFVYLYKDHYEFDKKSDSLGTILRTVGFKDKQEAYFKFWQHYKRPPKKEYWDYIVKRRDLLVPQDIRERKGSFFTPQIWVEKSQEYLEKVLGENWQDEYYVWDCCAGTGNLLAGLTNKKRIWASTLDKADVAVMHDRIKNGASLRKSHVFQFDFLNDSFDSDKIPDELKAILKDPNKRKKLVIYINPPYAEATSSKTVAGTGKNKAKVATDNQTYQKYKDAMGQASNELFAQFFIRIGFELNGCILGEFSKLKILQAQNFKRFRQAFDYKLEDFFVVPADTFDNVQGKFPIGFFIWNTSKQQEFEEGIADVYNRKGEFEGKKTFYGNLPDSINKWIKVYDNPLSLNVGYMENPTPDIQNNKYLCITNDKGTRHNNYSVFNSESMFPSCIYFSARLCMPSTWLNDRDQFIWPNDNWMKDAEFQSDCLAFTLFHGQNRITSTQGINHWIPFDEDEVGCEDDFDSHFMTEFIRGELGSVSDSPFVPKKKLRFSKEAITVFNAGKALWKYYFKHNGATPNASLYDIREFFQGRDENGRMLNTSSDETYNGLIADLRSKVEKLGEKIRPKVYEYGFLKE